MQRTRDFVERTVINPELFGHGVGKALIRQLRSGAWVLLGTGTRRPLPPRADSIIIGPGDAELAWRESPPEREGLGRLRLCLRHQR